jgi:hypothetical protein
MYKMEKDKVYDELSKVLTDYEHEPMSAEEAAFMFYDMLVKIQNNWDELTSEEPKFSL